jgi:hypothetical protein
LNLRGLAQYLVQERSNWDGSTIERVVFCTARINGASNPSGARDQNVYLRALQAANAVDVGNLPFRFQ